jgi:type IX secretion system PorP/SprF family membrane protein
MKKIIIILISVLILNSLKAQQSVEYTQFTMNDFGLNPAVAGYIKGLQFMTGRRTQWRGFALAPITQFASVTKNIGKKHSYKRYWHGVGIYLEQDEFGLFHNKVAYGTYAFHLKLTPKYTLSFGFSSGIKQVFIDNIVYDANDPALALKPASVLLYPDIIPGLYLNSSKLSIGLSIRNIYKNTLNQGAKEIGTPSRLLPNAYFTASKKFLSFNYDYAFIPAVLVQTNLKNLPVTNFNFMAYYRQRIGIGLSYRMHDAISAMIQVRIYTNLVVGFSYDYTISKFRYANANSTEIMMGFTPLMSNEGLSGDVSACPKFEY